MLRRLIALSRSCLAAGGRRRPVPNRSANEGSPACSSPPSYPALTVKAGETTTLDLSVHNFKLPPQMLTVSVSRDRAAGGRRRSSAAGQPVGAVAVTTDGEQSGCNFAWSRPPAVGHGDYRFTLEAKNAGQDLKLPITVTIGEEVPAKLKMTTRFPGACAAPRRPRSSTR